MIYLFHTGDLASRKSGAIFCAQVPPRPGSLALPPVKNEWEIILRSRVLWQPHRVCEELALWTSLNRWSGLSQVTWLGSDRDKTWTLFFVFSVLPLMPQSLASFENTWLFTWHFWRYYKTDPMKSLLENHLEEWILSVLLGGSNPGQVVPWANVIVSFCCNLLEIQDKMKKIKTKKPRSWAWKKVTSSDTRANAKPGQKAGQLLRGCRRVMSFKPEQGQKLKPETFGRGFRKERTRIL